VLTAEPRCYTSAMRYFPLSLAALCLVASAASAQDTSWTLSTADFKTEQVVLRSIDDAGVTVVPAAGGEPRVVPAAAFLQVERTLTPPGDATAAGAAKFMMHLSTGDRVGGEPVKVENDQLTWNNAAVGELVVPLTQLAAITKAGQLPDAGRRTEDVVALANGDSVRGIVTSLAGGQVQVKPGGGADAVPVPLDAVVSIHFASAAAASGSEPAANAQGPRLYRLRLDDGSSVVGSSLSLSPDGKLSLAVGGGGAGGAGAAPRPLDLARVGGIEQVNGPVRWLTSVTPSQDVYVPFVASQHPLWRTRVDTDVAGDPFVVGGRTLKRGIGVHAMSRLVYPLDGSFKAFRTRYGINDSLVRADVTVRIRVVDQVAHEAKNVKAGVLSPVVVVELGDAKELVLEVDYGQGIDVEDRLNWLEPALLREVPKAEAPATAPAVASPAPEPAPAPAAKGQAPAGTAPAAAEDAPDAGAAPAPGK
jgi:hypothetical protein